MEADKVIEIPISKAKLSRLLIFSLLFIFLGLWMIIADPQVSNPVFNSPVFKGVASHGSLLMGLLGTYFFARKMLDSKPGLILSDQGIYDNSSAFKFGFILWSDVSGIFDASLQSGFASKERFVTIGLLDHEKYISREKSPLKRKLLKIKSKSFGSPVHISTNGLKTNHKELLALVTGYFEKYKKSS